MIYYTGAQSAEREAEETIMRQWFIALLAGLLITPLGVLAQDLPPQDLFPAPDELGSD